VPTVLADNSSRLASAFRRAARVHAWFGLLLGVGLFLYAVVLPRYTGLRAVGRGFDYALMCILSSPVLVAIGLAYAVFSVLVRLGHLWAVIVLIVAWAAQGSVVAFFAFCLLDRQSLDAPRLGIACATYAAALLASAVLGALVTIERLGSGAW